VAALRLLRRRAFAVYFLCNFGLCVTLPFSSQNTPLLLLELGLPKDWLGPALTIAQSTEVVALGLLPLLLGRWGHRRLMLAGALAWTTAMMVMTVGRPLGLVVGCLALNGVFICCYLVAGQVFVNSAASGDIRASAQSLLTFTNGLGMLVGNLLAGWVRDRAGGAFAPTFGVAAAIALLALLIFSAGFRHSSVASASRE
jgi:NHS family xanthosine MFS transporter